MVKLLGTCGGWVCHQLSRLVYHWSNLLRFGHAIALVLDLRRNDIWSNNFARFWGVLEVPARYAEMCRYGKNCSTHLRRISDCEL